ncbi:acetyl-CoA C-acyltransferase [Pimelobacter simplex]|uniref:Acetyl-CoA acetyltransferase n=1 Tax=Nocardioides simplex TaxID=2045 RepID=A0A0A1DK26_NOCSI|nr:thiolase family protein [Pimelobacter simplex]AIY16928.1 acetyl-CoA acetyltransferase fadA6 [Pimelobacter simplex]MCG8152071.1 acetyl-CoA C-acyltransferase [Pimelobacter simplex]GEB12824.1 acetyl-CoA acyltransferase [Pimelobacter simplex]SFM53714.1 acetyl-CoA acyltransferase [Pimelobacter simplex]
MNNAVIVDAVRTPLAKGKPGGAYAEIHPVDLHAHALRAIVDRTGIDPAAIDDVISGAVGQVGEQSGNTARWALLAAGYPESVPGVTVDRQCGSSQQALHFAAQGVIAGAYDVAVASGVESMSRIPIGSQFAGKDFFGPQVQARYEGRLVPQGISAELIARKWGLSRAELDEYSALSHERAARAWKDGLLDSQVAFVNELRTDETIRPGTTADVLAGLRPAFYSEEWAAAYPELDWRITAGNSSPVNDGAAAVLVTSEDAAARLGLRPRARVHSFAVVGDDPVLMLTGIIPATRKVLERAGLTLADIDAFEVNEAFASVVLAWQKETGADLDKVNVNGGAISIGHPLGASGARLATSLVNVLEQRGGRYGLQVMCEAGGLANATIIERV